MHMTLLLLLLLLLLQVRATHEWHACRSTAPSAFTGYSFHVLEAIIVFTNEILICFLLPLHLGLHRIYHIFTTIIHQGVQAFSCCSSV
jgi:hypothetical protein